MERNETIKEFLKEYADILRTDIDISNVLPIGTSVSMPGGCIKLISLNEEHMGLVLGYVTVDEGGGPSCPIGPGAMTFARLIKDLVNAWGKFNGGV